MVSAISRLLGPWAPLAAFGGALLIAGGIYTAGYRAAAHECRAGQYKAERDAALRDLERFRTAARVAEESARAAEVYADELQRKVDDYVASLVPSNSCKLTRDDVERLRNIK